MRLSFSRHPLERKWSRCFAAAAATTCIITLGLPAWMFAAACTSGRPLRLVDQRPYFCNKGHDEPWQPYDAESRLLTLHCEPNLQSTILSASVSVHAILMNVTDSLEESTDSCDAEAKISVPTD